MQIKIYTIPIPGGESLTEDMNVFLRSKKILQVTDNVVSNDLGAHWCFCIKYLDDAGSLQRQKVDYRYILDDASFQRFSRMREIRKELAKSEAIPAYNIFTDEELAGLAKIEDLTIASMRNVRGVGEKKVEKYGAKFVVASIENEKGK
jgi:superfamily II DNA helicase RecQ